ncbi:MAG: hypothetical protein R3270_02925 [Gammaproteobacteria bacterium]|nr:hypothetical protein [Gammaproteobacteria bacterium]
MKAESDPGFEYRQALMELEEILEALDGTPEAERRDELIEAVLRHEGALP